MTFDEGAMSYLETQTLEIIILDDNYPVTGIENGGQGEQDDDMIGICKIPLADMAQGLGIAGEFTIIGTLGEPRGLINLKLTVVNTSGGADKGDSNKLQDARDANIGSYNAKWEQDLIMKIAKKLGGLSIDVELMFGIFSRGLKSCTREDFKYCCLRRLNLDTEIPDKEMDFFLEKNDRLRGKTTIEQKDFVEIFGLAINKARNEH